MEVAETEIGAATFQGGFVQAVTALDQRVVGGARRIDMHDKRQEFGRGLGARLFTQAGQGFGGPARVRQVQQRQVEQPFAGIIQQFADAVWVVPDRPRI